MPPPPLCTGTPYVHKFGNVTVGLTKDLSFQVKNIGGSVMSALVSVGCSGFSLLGTARGFDLGPGQVATFTIRFAPTVTGPQQCYVMVGGCAYPLAIGTGV